MCIHNTHRNQAYLKPAIMCHDPLACPIKEALHRQKNSDMYIQREDLWDADNHKLRSFDKSNAFARSTVMMAKDFAAKLAVPRKLTKTCQTDPAYHEWVGVIECNPRLYRIPMSISRRKRKDFSRNQRSQVRSQKYAFFAFSDRKHDAVYDQQCTRDMTHLIKHGKLPADCKSEWFYKNRRLRGSCTERALPMGITDADCDEPVAPDVEQIIVRRDKCAAQYHGLHAFYSVQEFERRNKVSIHDHANTSRHGKCICDGVSMVPKKAVQLAAEQNKKLQPGCRGLVLYLALNSAKPCKNGDGFTGYFFAFYPEGAFDESLYKAQDGYSGCTKDHFLLVPLQEVI